MLEAQNEELAREAQRLQTPSEIERLAREQFNMVLPGEQAYNVVSPPPVGDDHHHDTAVAPLGSAFAEPRLRRLGGVPATDSDVAALTVLLGRVPRGEFEVVVRDAAGAPVVIRNAPLLDDGTPMPTRYWLVDPDARHARRRASSRPAACARPRPRSTPDELARAHERYAAERDAALPAEHDGPAAARRRRRHAARREVPARALRVVTSPGGDDPVGRWVGRAPRRR